MGIARENEIQDIVRELLADYDKDRAIDQRDVSTQIDEAAVVDIVQKFLRVLFPGYYRKESYSPHDDARNLSYFIEEIEFQITRQITGVLRGLPAYAHVDEPVVQREALRLALAFLHRIPALREVVNTDLEAAFDGDPAAKSMEEIVLAYPGLLAITIYRIAHELFVLRVPLIPRMMTEYAHGRTGVDIHPGATIGRYFFIDHATGVVIGETSIIGERVKLYQGVTIGALSTRGGQKLKGVKRHPTIEDNVTIYSGASILGGETVIGRNSVIGGNSFITRSIKPNTRVSIKNQELQIDERDGEAFSEHDIEPGAWFYTI
ncbi:MAG: serine acetyltransferase [Schwartzia sp.]|nr:serine acetyltransferase [Schwartzia sp. (in: firmicutes)]MBR1885100.1 serine acetyltransferase [Schwartzia sp. (in: firmicutes)]